MCCVCNFRKEDVDPLADRLGRALKHAGVSITLTSLSSVTAFAVGATIDIPAIRAFASFSAFAFLSNYILQVFLCFFVSNCFGFCLFVFIYFLFVFQKNNENMRNSKRKKKKTKQTKQICFKAHPKRK